MQPFFQQSKQRFANESAAIIRLVGPIMVAQLTVTGMSFVDTIMAGSVSSTDLAAIAVGASFFHPVILFLQGIIIAVTPLVAYQIGARTPHRAGAIVQQAIWISLILALLSWGVINQLPYVFGFMDVDPDLVSKTKDYLFYISFGLPAFAVYQVLRSVNEAASNIKIIMFIGIAGLALNIPVNYVFINGLLGLPALGGAGCGVATSIVNYFMAGCLMCYVWRSQKLQHLKICSRFFGLQTKHIKRIFSLGLPIGSAIFFEVTLFSIIALLIAPLGTDVVAAHQVALNFSSLVFMLPLSIGIALTIRVGNFVGAKDYLSARTATYTGLILGMLLTVFIASCTVIFRHDIIAWYTNNPEVISIAAPLFLLAATYQFSDSLQVCAGGALRGYHDTRFIMYVTLISFWPIGLGIGSILTFTDYLSPEPLGVQGFWIAIIIALTACAIGLVSRLFWLAKNPQHVNIA